jgi:DNA polymerase-3 subunit delta'
MSSGRVAPAYIFLGPSGVGKSLTALNFAKALNCLVPGPDKERNGELVEPCDECASCRKIASSNHPDVFFLGPLEGKASISIDQIREVINNISLKPYEGRRKVYVIDPADTFRHEAANALLKTLEEPPSESVLILITRNLSSLFRTIVSRSQVVRFFPLGPAVIEEILVKGHSVPAAEAGVLSRIAGGSVAEALKFKDGAFPEKRNSLLDALAAGEFPEPLFEKAAKDDLRAYLDMMLAWYRDILAVKCGAGDSALLNADRVKTIAQEARRRDERYIEEVLKQIMLTNVFLDQNANPKVAMSVLEEMICTR